MALRAPRFWENPPARPGLAAQLLTPMGWIWAAASRRRLARGEPARAGAPVICLGNLTVGGTGKTPAVVAVLERLAARRRAGHVLSRGYGGSVTGPLRVDPQRHGAEAVGDEPLLLAAFAPVWVGRDRAASARAAVAAGAEVLVMDDGFQNPGLAKDISIVMVDAERGFGNGRVMPAGPLREDVAAGLARADLVLAVGPREARAGFVDAWPQAAALPGLDGELRPLRTGMDWQGLRAFAFAGIGRPEKFFATLRGLGAEVVGTRAFGDHAAYAPALCARLVTEAGRLGAQLVTTEKDAVRMPQRFAREVLVLPVRLEVEDWAPFDARLERLGL